MVPVEVSIWLSKAVSLPRASSVWLSRVTRNHGQRLGVGGTDLRQGLFRQGESDAIGLIWVITAMPVAPDAETRLPTSTWRMPTTPANGALMR